MSVGLNLCPCEVVWRRRAMALVAGWQDRCQLGSQAVLCLPCLPACLPASLPAFPRAPCRPRPRPPSTHFHPSPALRRWAP